MTDRADEIARKIVRENTDDVEEYAELEFAITAALRVHAEEARRDTLCQKEGHSVIGMMPDGRSPETRRLRKTDCVACVEQAIEVARREEREACAKTLDAFPPTGHSPAFVEGYAFACLDGAAAIRARGKKG